MLNSFGFMTEIKVLVLENDSSFVSVLKINLNKWGRLDIVVTKNMDEARAYLEEGSVDLIIAQPSIRTEGDVLDFIAATSAKIPLILISDQASNRIYQKARALNLLAFLVKPFDFKTLHATLKLYFNNKENFLLINRGRDTKRIMYNRIAWIRSAGNYCIIRAGKKEHSMKISLTRLKEDHLNDDFIQIHRAFIIRIDKISSINIKMNMVNIAGFHLPIGRKFKKAFFDRIEII